ncbi:hypothetical protein [Arthrobacter caoxuetaonis]|uniref:Uncharacterized protein n=1 Tax=Arthrobacter caoxuetaonis TaxID=2886935 RepID=A0A9X1MHG6_9MICC|nr:hypothetical protein [Arthrobacter caoxuetaonis]MCC3298987.1 hypothetical protein [Arthrobacter caoxuetaonis]USQ58672.1 hypothetical protein NF551_07640 [Arthrobacter caoxuetaonis]
MRSPLDEQQRHVVPIVLGGVLIISAYALIGALQITVWNPMAAVPGMSLQEIKTAMSSVNEPLVETPVYAWALAGPVLALTVGTFSIVKFPDLPWTITRYFLILIMLGTPTYYFVSFSPGMSLADAFSTTGGDHSPWSRILYGMSILALILLLLTLRKKDQKHGKATQPLP